MEVKQSVAVLGSGIVGRSWVVLFARGGYHVNLYDVSEKQIETAVADVKKKLQLLEEHKMLNGGTAEELVKRVHPVSDLAAALKDVVYAQECIPEALQMKADLFKQLDAWATQHKNDSTVFASSTSNIPASSFTEQLGCRARCLVAHPINPPFAIPLVELVCTPWTSKETVESTRALMTRIGLSPIVLKKEVDGFVVNRLQYALLGEAYRLVEDGVCDARDVDKAVSDGLGLRWSFMGPFQTIDINAKGVSDYCERYSEGIMRVLKTEDNNRQWKKETVDKIDKEMRTEVPLEDLDKRIEWRNTRLMQLALHKQAMAAADKDKQQQQEGKQ